MSALQSEMSSKDATASERVCALSITVFLTIAAPLLAPCDVHEASCGGGISRRRWAGLAGWARDTSVHRLRPSLGRETRTGQDDSCLSSASLIAVGSARPRVAFRTNPISLFIALGFPFFRSITFKNRNYFRGENRDSCLKKS